MVYPGLELNFQLYAIFGIWNQDRSSVYIRILNSFAGIYFYCSLVLYMFLGIYEFFFYPDDIEESMKNMNICSVIAGCLFKLIVIRSRRGDVLDMLRVIADKECLPQNPEEEEILEKYRRLVRFVTKSFLSMSTVTGTILVTAPLIYDNGNGRRNFPYHTSRLYDAENIVSYTLIYLYHISLIFVGMPIDVASDTFISGVMILACGQFELLHARLGRVRNYNDVRKCVRQHQEILKFSRYISDTFNGAIFVQFFFNLINISALTLTSSMLKSAAATLESGLFLICMMTELMLYCWYGNQVFLMSRRVATETLSNENWASLSTRSKKALLFMSMQSHNATEIKAASMLNISMETYMMIIKTSYSTFSLLRGTS